MAKLEKRKVICSCCKSEVEVQRVLSFSSNKISFDGNMHHPLQYQIQECPKCHYASVDISDSSVKVSRGMLNSFRIKPVYEKIKNPLFINIMKAADVYEKNRFYYSQAYMLRLASFLVKEEGVIALSRNLLRLANVALEKFFTELDCMELKDIETAVILVDCNRQLGIFKVAETMCEDLLNLLHELGISDEENFVYEVLNYEKNLIINKDMDEHLMSEVL